MVNGRFRLARVSFGSGSGSVQFPLSVLFHFRTASARAFLDVGVAGVKSE
jgi:hypothetical protein